MVGVLFFKATTKTIEYMKKRERKAAVSASRHGASRHVHCSTLFSNNNGRLNLLPAPPIADIVDNLKRGFAAASRSC
jgi:hypothetical protein